MKKSFDISSLTFPKGFLFGSSTSAYQVEGGNVNADWWAWEQEKPENMHSRKACDHYNLYEKDFNLAKKLNQNAHRLSVEWSRIEPREGEFDQREIEHYQKVLKSLKQKNLKVMLTLWHFTLPKWVSDKGGWTNSKTNYYFLRFLKKLVPYIKDYVDYWVVLNEPGGYMYSMYLCPKWPNSKKSIFLALKTFFNFISVYKNSYKLLKKLDQKKPVGIADNYQSYQSYSSSILEKIIARFSQFYNNKQFYQLTKGYHDFIGINYYFHHILKISWDNFIPKVVEVEDQNKIEHALPWEDNNQGLLSAIKDVRANLPILITECGTAVEDEDLRVSFLINRFKQTLEAINQGKNIKGFFYWSLLDNFEWESGYNMKFGLVEVDFKTQKRKIREVARVYSEIIQNNLKFD